jgi:hypothetical protein
MAATSPACWSEMTSLTPERPRSLSDVRNVRQNSSSSQVAHVDTQDFSVPVLSDARGDDDGLGDDVVIASHVEVVGGRAEARCRHLGRSSPRPAPPNRTCGLHRIRLSERAHAADYATSFSVIVTHGVGTRFAR